MRRGGEKMEKRMMRRKEAWKSVFIFFNPLLAIWHCWDAILLAAL